MKVLLYIIAGLMFIIWGMLIVGFKTSASVHLLLVAALILIIFNFLFGKRLSKK